MGSRSTEEVTRDLGPNDDDGRSELGFLRREETPVRQIVRLDPEVVGLGRDHLHLTRAAVLRVRVRECHVLDGRNGSRRQSAARDRDVGS